MIDRKRFFDAVRREPFDGKLTSGQVGGMEAILAEWERRKLTDLRWLAYMLATTIHETARTMQPIAEFGKGKGRKYGVPTGPYKQVYYGRGFVQLTWLENYQRAAKAVGVDLVRYPDQALRTDIAAKVMFDGMIEGWFAGDSRGRHKLTRYFNAKVTDWIGARRIINGTDKASTIADYAKTFHAALVGAERPDAVPVMPQPPVTAPVAGDGLGEDTEPSLPPKAPWGVIGGIGAVVMVVAVAIAKIAGVF